MWEFFRVNELGVDVDVVVIVVVDVNVIVVVENDDDVSTSPLATEGVDCEADSPAKFLVVVVDVVISSTSLNAFPLCKDAASSMFEAVTIPEVGSSFKVGKWVTVLKFGWNAEFWLTL